MSLIVAQSTKDGPRIVSDTRVGFVDGTRSSFKTAMLKAIVVNEKFSVCFAGDVNAGLKGVRDFSKGLSEGVPVKELLVGLQDFIQGDARSFDFIIAEAEPDSKLIRITKAGIEENLNSAWIGDKDAFECFQKQRLKPLEPFWESALNEFPEGVKIMTLLAGAMQAVINDPAISSVDDFNVRVAAKENKFNYLEGAFAYVERDFDVTNGEVVNLIRPVEEGGYSVSMVEPLDPGTPALGLSFPVARVAMIYLPLLFDEAQVISDVAPNDFSSVIFDRYGVKMKEPMIRSTISSDS